MIIVTGRVLARPESLDALLAASLEHVRRSRTEPGCVQHSVHQDVEDPLAVFFYEQWEDRDALAAHFKVPASREFVTVLAELATEPPTMHIYSAEPFSFR